jgi:hypothetical protein
MSDTQAARILDYLQTHDGITPLQALDLFGCFRLAARISDLREAGWPVVTDRLHLANGKVVALYRLEGYEQPTLGL